MFIWLTSMRYTEGRGGTAHPTTPCGWGDAQDGRVGGYCGKRGGEEGREGAKAFKVGSRHGGMIVYSWGQAGPGTV